MTFLRQPRSRSVRAKCNWSAFSSQTICVHAVSVSSGNYRQKVNQSYVAIRILCLTDGALSHRSIDTYPRYHGFRGPIGVCGRTGYVNDRVLVCHKTRGDVVHETPSKRHDRQSQFPVHYQRYSLTRLDCDSPFNMFLYKQQPSG